MSDNTVRVAVTDKYIYVRAPFALKDKFNEITGARCHAPDQAYRMPVSASTAREILVAFKGCKVLDAGGFAPLVEQVKAMKQASAAKEADAGTLPPIPVTKNEPWPHQLSCFWFVSNLWGGLPQDGGGAQSSSRNGGGVMLAVGMGGG